MVFSLTVIEIDLGRVESEEIFPIDSSEPSELLYQNKK
jgi:hypothetical protein